MKTNTKDVNSEAYFNNIHLSNEYFSSLVPSEITIEPDGVEYGITKTEKVNLKNEGDENSYEYINVNDVLTKYFQTMYSIKGIYILDDRNVTQVWIVISEDTQKIREEIYDAEYEILQKYTFLKLDFHINALKDGFSSDIVPTNSIQLIIK